MVIRCAICEGQHARKGTTDFLWAVRHAASLGGRRSGSYRTMPGSYVYAGCGPYGRGKLRGDTGVQSDRQRPSDALWIENDRFPQVRAVRAACRPLD